MTRKRKQAKKASKKQASPAEAGVKAAQNALQKIFAIADENAGERDADGRSANKRK